MNIAAEDAPFLDDDEVAGAAAAVEPPTRQHVQVPSLVKALASPADRVFGAQQVNVRRDDARVLQQIAYFAAQAGDRWFYRWPIKDNRTNKTTWVEGPSVKCTNDVARLYGNCDVDIRVIEQDDSWVFYARFIDLETGYSLTRPFQQRKGQQTLKTRDRGRAEDLVFQIGASKATRNVVRNALQFHVDRAFEEARDALVNKVGKDTNGYRKRISEALERAGIDAKRVERVVGRTIPNMHAPDLAGVIAVMQSIADGMTSWEEAYPTEPGTANPLNADDTPAPQKGAGGPKPGPGPTAQEAQQAAREPAVAPETAKADEGPAEDHAAERAAEAEAEAQESKRAAKPKEDKQKAAAPKAADKPAAGAAVMTKAEYIAHARRWMAAGLAADPDTIATAGSDLRTRWSNERKIRSAITNIHGAFDEEELGGMQTALHEACRRVDAEAGGE